jgi:hypothetical protein
MPLQKALEVARLGGDVESITPTCPLGDCMAQGIYNQIADIIPEERLKRAKWQGIFI